MPIIDHGNGDGPNLDDVEDTETDPDAVTLREYITLEVDRAITALRAPYRPTIHLELTPSAPVGQAWKVHTTGADLGSVTVTDPPGRPAGDHTTAKDTNQ